MTLVVWSSTGEILNSSTLLALPRQMLDRDWYHHLVRPAPRVALAVDSTFLHFIADFPKPTAQRAAPARTFFEGLWEGDVAELFVCSDTPNGAIQYQEFNLAPNAAYWSCAFSAYRQRAPADKQPIRGLGESCKTFASETEHEATAILSIPRGAVCLQGDITSRARMHCTGVRIDPVADPQVPQYLTFTPLTAPEPDFHRFEQFRPISVRPLGPPGSSAR